MDEYVFYKFRKVGDRMLESLERNAIYFARPSSLNDPFDCQVPIAALLERLVAAADSTQRRTLETLRTGMRDFFTQLEADIANLAVCSFSLEPLNSLMWAHYAKDHCGIALKYQFPSSFFNDRSDRILGVDEMKYGVNPVSDWFLSWANAPTSWVEFRNQLLIRMVTVKAEAWRHEAECRIVRGTEGIEELPREYLKAVCFGMRTPQADIDRISEILHRQGFAATRCQIVRDNVTDFGIDAIEI